MARRIQASPESAIPPGYQRVPDIDYFDSAERDPNRRPVSWTAVERGPATDIPITDEELQPEVDLLQSGMKSPNLIERLRDFVGQLIQRA